MWSAGARGEKTQGSAQMPKGIKKQELPVKICAHCAKPFTWRKKWARDWNSVKYCSERCRRGNAG
ncbi:MAG: DUF2256 domain-containing protein [Planktotalea sp.]|uniref:DUF2256 domain-containing protein n=1 Tax=Planktotalea sp. TaxID=2029877 RepID=UPI003C78C39C